jgi:hypothetical protein
VEIINPGNAAASPADIGHLCPGDMDRYADRLDSAADRAGKTKLRPDGPDQGEHGKRSSL